MHLLDSLCQSMENKTSYVEPSYKERDNLTFLDPFPIAVVHFNLREEDNIY